MNYTKELKVFRPFGPAIAEVDVNESFIRDLNEPYPTQQIPEHFVKSSKV